MDTKKELLKNIEDSSAQLVGLIHAVISVSASNKSQKRGNLNDSNPQFDIECFRILSLRIRKNLIDSVLELSEIID